VKAEPYPVDLGPPLTIAEEVSTHHTTVNLNHNPRRDRDICPRFVNQTFQTSRSNGIPSVKQTRTTLLSLDPQLARFGILSHDPTDSRAR